jgi:hypothetical protein
VRRVETFTTIMRWVLMTAGVVMPLFLASVFARLMYLRHVDPKRHERIDNPN